MAAAVGAVLALGPSIRALLPGPDPADRAAFTSISVTSGIPLSEYQGRVSGGASSDVDLLLVDGAPLNLEPIAEQVMAQPAEPAAEPEEPAAEPEEPPLEPEELPPPTAPPKDEPSDPPVGDEASDPLSPSHHDGPSGTPSESATEPSQPVDPPEVRVELYGLNAERARVVTDRVYDGLGGYAWCPTKRCEKRVKRTLKWLTVDVVKPDSVGPAGDILSADEVAARIVEFLGETRTIATPKVDPGESDGQAVVTQPVGAAMTANIELVGLRGQPVLLSWSIHQLGGDTRLFGRWLRDTPVYRLEPTSEHDTTSVNLWIPLPKSPGPYFVRLVLELDDSPLVSGESAPFD